MAVFVVLWGDGGKGPGYEFPLPPISSQPGTTTLQWCAADDSQTLVHREVPVDPAPLACCPERLSLNYHPKTVLPRSEVSSTAQVVATWHPCSAQAFS